MNIDKIRQHFPFFQRLSIKHSDVISKSIIQLAYFDNAATTHKPTSVIEAITNFYRNDYATVHRALYPFGEASTMMYESVRDKTAAFINAASRDEIIFTKGTTESINCIAQSWALHNLKDGDTILLTQAEHHANLLPWQMVAKKTGAKLVFIPIDQVTFELINPLGYITSSTKLIAFSLYSNILGPLWNHVSSEYAAFIKKAHEFGALVLIDAAQSVAHTSTDVQKLGADFLVFSGHKMFGPTGVGVLYIKKQIQETLSPYQLGGSMVYEASFYDASWVKGPHRFEAGTPPIAAVIGLGTAIDFMHQNLNFDALQKHEHLLWTMLVNGMQSIFGLFIVGNVNTTWQKNHIVTFFVDGIHPHDLAFDLGQRGIAIRAGHHCAQPLIMHLGYESLLRVSVSVYNTQEEVMYFLDQLRISIALFRSSLGYYESKPTS